MAYVSINEVNYNKETSVIEMDCTDIESILLNDWTDEMTEAKELTFRFDLTQKGHRIYLFKICHSNAKEGCKSMLEQVISLKGKCLNISSNFIGEAGE